MNNLREIKDFDVLAGTSIKEAVEEAIKLAIINKCIIRFDFNEIQMKIYDFSDIKSEVEYYGRRLNEK